MTNAAQRQELLTQALAVTREMAALGDAGDWLAVVEIEPRRRALLEQAFDGQGAADEQTVARINEILSIDKELMRQGEEARSRIAGELGQMHKGRKGADAYRKLGR